ncbi:ABC transporter permease subunit [Chitinophaga sp. NPDC101104]|uniref:ABC transporter permease subunit n=1 Tax=Chitinophaga sp. NPDC101104 TaxID=3390561 RepID=UPI003D07E9C7
MKTTIQITKNELRNMFYSPIAWFLLIIFTLMCAYFYTGAGYMWAKMSQIPYANDPDFKWRATESVTSSIYMGPNGILTNVLQTIYLFVPLLTMGVISREINAGTIKLLYSSPVRISRIVLGKFLALMLYNLLLVAIVGIFVVNGFFDVQSLDYGPLLSTLLAFYLLLCALTAVGFYMSSLTTYPIVAAIASFTVFFVLMNIGWVWQQYDFVRDLTWFMSIAGRTEKMVWGLIVSRDVLYYLVIICMFIGFTWLRLQGGREKLAWYVRAARYAAVVAVCLMVGYVGSMPRFSLYKDVTAQQINTVRPASRELIEALDGPLEVTLYTNLIGPGANAGLPSRRNLYLADCWDRYRRFKWDIHFKYEYYYDADSIGPASIFNDFKGKTMPQIAAEMAKTMQVDVKDFKTPETMRREIDLRPEGLRLVMRLQYKDRSVFLRTYGGGDWPGTVHIDAALARLLGRPIPKIAFVTGHLERSLHKTGEREYSSSTIIAGNPGSLVNIGFDIDTVNLAVQDIAPNVTAVVVADPKIEYGTAEMEKLQRYFDGGGNMLLLGEPGKEHVIGPLLRKTGVRMIPGKLMQPSERHAPEEVVTYLPIPFLEILQEEPARLFHRLWSHGVRDDTAQAVMPGAAGLAFSPDSGFTSVALLNVAPGSAWSKVGKFVADSVAPVFSAAEGDIRQDEFQTFLRLTRNINGKEQRIMVAGDADFLGNRRMPTGWLIRGIASWLSGDRMPVYAVYPYAEDNMLTLRTPRAVVQKIAYTWVLPGLLALFGTVLLIRRKRK